MGWNRRQQDKNKLSGEKNWTRAEKEQIKAYLEGHANPNKPDKEQEQRKAS